MKVARAGESVALVLGDRAKELSAEAGDRPAHRSVDRVFTSAVGQVAEGNEAGAPLGECPGPQRPLLPMVRSPFIRTVADSSLPGLSAATGRPTPRYRSDSRCLLHASAGVFSFRAR